MNEPFLKFKKKFDRFDPSKSLVKSLVSLNININKINSEKLSNFSNFVPDSPLLKHSNHLHIRKHNSLEKDFHKLYYFFNELIL